MLKTVTKSMVDSMIGIMRSKSMMRLVVKAVLRMMSFVSILGMGNIMVWIHWSATFMSDLMCPGLVIHVMCDFTEVV